MKKNWVANIVKNLEDGIISLSYVDMDTDYYHHLSLGEFIEEVEDSDYWDFIDEEVYQVAFDGVGLSLSEYDDMELSDYDNMDEAWEDFLQAAKNYK